MSRNVTPTSKTPPTDGRTSRIVAAPNCSHGKIFSSPGKNARPVAVKALPALFVSAAIASVTLAVMYGRPLYRARPAMTPPLSGRVYLALLKRMRGAFVGALYKLAVLVA